MLRLVLLSLLGAAAALQITTPSNVEGNTTLQVTFTTNATDMPVITFELNGPGFLQPLGIAVNTITSAQNFTAVLPDDIPAGDNYQIIAVAPGNLDDIIAVSANFSIAQHDAPPPGSSTSSSSSGSSSGTSTSASSGSTQTASGAAQLVPGLGLGAVLLAGAAYALAL